MNYQQTLDWMFQQLPMYQHQGASAYKANLDNTLLLAAYLGHPEKELPCLHVAGTNGKGSTSHLLAAVFQEAGYRVGLYTSPHLKDYRERIKINGKPIKKKYVTSFIAQHKAFLEQHQLSFFEMSVGLAFSYFKEQKTEINIIEVGMGGRLDSTNIITPDVAVITNIGKDHTQFLGDTLEKIAVEKAGIIKKGIPVVIGEYTAETKAVFDAKAQENQSEIFYASDIQLPDIPAALTGDYQQANKKTVLQTLRVVQKQGKYHITEEHIRKGFMQVIKTTGLLGRWQHIHTHPTALCDTAHNAHGLKIVMQQLARQEFEQLHLVLGVVNDKDLTDILPLFPKKATYYFCKPAIPRGLAAEELAKQASLFGLQGAIYRSVSEAYQSALVNAGREDLIYVGGSTFVVAEIL